jgi:hypothetical protein
LGLSLLIALALVCVSVALGVGWAPSFRGASTLAGKDIVDPAEVIHIDTLIPAIQATFGSRLGSVRLDESTSVPTVMVRVKAPTAADHRALADLMKHRKGVGVISPAIMASSELRDLQSTVVQILLNAGTQGPVSVMPNEEAGVIEIDAPSIEPPVIAKLRQYVPATNLSIRIEPSSRLEYANSTRDTYPPYEGGLRVVDPVVNKQCTGGFTFTSAGLLYASTAGHCGHSGSFWNVGPTFLGIMTKNTTVGPSSFSDAALITSRDARAVVYQGNNSDRPVLRRLLNSELTLGRTLCTSGGVSNLQCSTINDRHGTVLVQGHVYNDVFCLVRHGQMGGDSGSPVFARQAKPYGVLAAGMVSFFHQDLVEGIDDVCFTTIYSIQNELGVQVATSG